jgi:phosphoglycerate dehydrogenase-like enzyme
MRMRIGARTAHRNHRARAHRTPHTHQVRPLDSLHHMLQEASILSSHLKQHQETLDRCS